MSILNPLDVPCGPILSMKELADEASLRDTGTVVEVDHPTRGKYLSVGNPIKLSDSPSDVERSPLLGEHTTEIMRDVLGFSDAEIEAAREAGVIGGEDSDKAAACISPTEPRAPPDQCHPSARRLRRRLDLGGVRAR